MSGMYRVRGVVAWVLVLSMVVGSPGLVVPAFAQATRIVHSPITGFVPGFRINVRASVVDLSGVSVVRCYFRAQGEADYVFVTMAPMSGTDYAGVMPAPSQNTRAIEYVLLAVTGDKTVVRSQRFVMTRQEGSEPTAWQTTNTSGQVSVSTELAQAPQTVAGFTDSIAADIVESAFRFGYVAENLYVLSQMVGPAPAGYQSAVSLATPGTAPNPSTRPQSPSSAAPVPVAKTATVVKSGGGSAWPWILIGVAVAGGVGAYFALRGTDELTAKTIVGNWTYSGTARGYTLTGTIAFLAGGSFTYNAVSSPISNARTGTGSWQLTGTTITIYENVEGWQLTGSFSGSKDQFSVSGSAGSYTFTRR